MRNLIIIISIFISFPIAAQNWAAIGKFNNSISTFYVNQSTEELYIGGSFCYFNSDTMVGMAKWNGTNMSTLGCGIEWDCIPAQVSGYTNPVYAMIRFDNNIFVTGSFLHAGGKIVNGIAKWDGNNWIKFGTGLKTTDGNPGIGLCLKEIDGTLYLGGVFDSINGIACHSLAKFDGSYWSPVNNFPVFWIYSNYPNWVYDIEKYNNELYVCGNFDNYPLMTISYITKWDGTNWVNVGNGINGGIIDARKMVVYKNELVVAGRFSKTVNPTNPGENIGKWNGTQWSELGSGTNDIIDDMKVKDGNLYICGAFSTAGGIPAHNLARWDGSKWCGFGNTLNYGIITSLDFLNDTLYIGGSFIIVNVDTIWNIAKWIGGNYVDTCSSTIGIEQIETQQHLITIYPNPATSILYINGLTTTATVEVYDISGKLLFTRQLNFHQIDISTLAKGLYFIKLTTKEGSVVRKFVKE
jgi:trimeric autotransporter adhesin